MSISTDRARKRAPTDTPMEVRVSAPSRLHFGLMSLGHRAGRKYGGVGLMIDAPGVRLRARRADRFRVVGALRERVEVFAGRFAKAVNASGPGQVEIDVESAPPDHVGLGTGTQLGLAVAAALNVFHETPFESVTELARSVGRGRRSAVGVHGFAEGGFLVEFGRRWRDRIAPLEYRVATPNAWRFVLVRPRRHEGLSGTVEERAFAALPEMSSEMTRALQTEVQERMVPAIGREDFAAFGESLYRYGAMAGKAFAPSQGGSFASAELEALVKRIRSWGFAGVAQSSWGPTLAVVVRDDGEAGALIDRVRTEVGADDLYAVDVARPQNRGATISVRSPNEAN